MSCIQLKNVSFHYTTPYKVIFSGLHVSIQSTWRTGLIGRNGRGKTTLLQLLRGAEHPDKGEVLMPLDAAYFPYTVSDASRTTHEVIRRAVAPYDEWEAMMATLSKSEDRNDLEKYADIHETYCAHHGYEIDAFIAKEADLCGLTEEMRIRSFSTLSSGERTRALIAALFLRTNGFVILDEPTNHLDIDGRRMLAEYLRQKSGFLVVSHDRRFLDDCIDHIVVLEKETVEVRQGNYSSWKYNKDLFDMFEQEKNCHLKKEITQMKQVARERRDWSSHTEKSKKSAYDSGYMGHLAAKMMKRAKTAEHRIDNAIEEKETLFVNRERERRLKLEIASKKPGLLAAFYNVSCGFNGRLLFQNISCEIHPGDRIAVSGPNGCGKTTLLRALCGEVTPLEGTVYLPAQTKIVRAHQEPLWREGDLGEHIRISGIDAIRFRTILGSFGVSGEVFDRPLEFFSAGELKKIELCRSLIEPTHLLVWDEPLNYIDIMSREQIEKVLLHDLPTIIFVEHDEYFIETIATKRICLD